MNVSDTKVFCIKQCTKSYSTHKLQVYATIVTDQFQRTLRDPIFLCKFEHI